MAAPSSLTLQYDAQLSTTLFNYRKTLEDQISTANVFFYLLKEKEANGYQLVEDLGDRAGVPLLYELAAFDSYSGYDTLPVTPMDGITMAFYDWRQLAIPISISGFEEKKNRGEAKILDLLEAKTEQATMGIQEGFSKMILQGEGMNDASTAGKIETGRVSPSNGSVGVDPLFLFLKKDPTTSTVVGNINQSTSTWWRNQIHSGGAATYAQFKKDLRKLNNNASKGPGGAPNLHLTDQDTAEFYEEVLSSSHRNPSYQKADLPFDSVGFRGKPVVWDEFMPNVNDRNVTLVNTKGTWAMINTKFWKIKVDKHTNFVNTPFEKPVNQDAKVAHILWLGAACLMNRRKQGVMFNINTTITS